MPSIGDNGGRKEWDALVSVYNYLISTYPDFQNQIDGFGFSTIEQNDKGELILELGNDDSDIVIESDKIIKLIKKSGIKRFSKVGSLTFDKALEYDYDMSRHMSVILVNRQKGTLSINLHFNYIEGDEVPKLPDFLFKEGLSSWSDDFDLNDFSKLFGDLISSPLHNEGLYWIHMIDDVLTISVVSGGVCVENIRYGDNEKLDVVIGRLLKYATDMYTKDLKEIFLLGEDISKVRYRDNNDGEITVVLY